MWQTSLGHIVSSPGLGKLVLVYRAWGRGHRGCICTWMNLLMVAMTARQAPGSSWALTVERRLTKPSTLWVEICRRFCIIESRHSTASFTSRSPLTAGSTQVWPSLPFFGKGCWTKTGVAWQTKASITLQTYHGKWVTRKAGNRAWPQTANLQIATFKLALSWHYCYNELNSQLLRTLQTWLAGEIIV